MRGGVQVGLILPGGLDPEGGRSIPAIEALVERLAVHAAVRAFATAVPASGRTSCFRGIPVTPVGGWPPGRGLATVLREHRRRRFDLFHAFWAGTPGLIASAAGLLTGRPAVLHLAGGELAALRDIGYGAGLSWPRRLAVRLSLAGASAVTAASTGLAEAAARAGVVVHLLPLGVDRGRWRPTGPRPRPEGRPARLVTVASLNPVKDHDTLLQAVRDLLDRGYVVELDVVGVDTMRGQVQHRAETLGLDRVVTFHGPLPNAALPPVMQQADLLVVSSRHEAGPVVLFEAGMLGVPTVGTRVGCVADWAPDAALTVPERDAGALASAIGTLLDDDVRRVRIGAAARRRATAQDADWTAQHVEMLYRRMVAPGSRHASRRIRRQVVGRPVPVFICGTARSGTTLMLRLFDDHPDLVVLPGETYFHRLFFDRGWRRWMLHLAELAPLPSLHRMLGRLPPAVPRRRHWTRRLAEWSEAFPGDGAPALDLDPVVTRHLRTRDPWGCFLDLYERRRPGRLAGASAVVEKTPSNERFVPLLERLFAGTPRYVHLIRDPRDVVASWVTLRSGPQADRWDLIAHVCYVWSRSNLAGRTSAGWVKGRYRWLRYEDLVASPTGVMGEVARWLGVAEVETLARASVWGKPVESNSSYGSPPEPGAVEPRSVGRYRDILTQAEVQMIEGRLGAQMTAWGYPLTAGPLSVGGPGNRTPMARLKSRVVARAERVCGGG